MEIINYNKNKVNKALFIYLKMYDADFEISSKTEYGMKRLPQLGIQYLSAVLKRRNIDVELLDQSIELFDNKFLINRIFNHEYDFIGFYSATALKKQIIECIEEIRLRGVEKPIIVGGPGHFGGDEYLQKGANIVCHGEGEITILEIIEYLNKKRPLSEVKGISYIQDGRIIRNPAQPLINDLDSIPFPDRSLYPIEKYYDFRIFGMRLPYITMLASRGCKYRCSFCSSSRHWNNVYRLRSVDNILQEIEELVEKYNIRYIGLKDDLFGGEESWLKKFLAKIIERKYPIRWSSMVHPLTFKKDCERKMELFKKAGCDFLSVGLQSSDKDILKAIRRSPEEPEVLAKLVKAAKRNNISILYEFILGLPGETLESIQKDSIYAFKNRPHYVQFYMLSKLEGSEIYNVYKDRKICKLSDEELKRHCINSMKLFYTNPAIIFYNLFHIIKKNPKWLIRAFRYLIYLLDATGIMHNKKERRKH